MSKEFKDKNIKLLKSIGKKLRIKRKELKISQGKIADLLNISDTQIYRYELGYSLMPLDNLLKLCELFNVDIYYFLNDVKSDDSIVKCPDNSELEKRVMMLREIYESKSEDLISVANTGIENVYSALKKQKKPKTGAVHRGKTRLEGNNK